MRRVCLSDFSPVREEQRGHRRRLCASIIRSMPRHFNAFRALDGGGIQRGWAAEAEEGAADGAGAAGPALSDLKFVMR
jgi:hypothetical protein